MSSSPARLLKSEPRKPVPLAERGRMLFVRDVQELIGKKPDGSYRKGEWWVRNSFAPDKKKKIGRDPYWWEIDAVEFLDSVED
jgi:hypothetical protein